MVELSRFLIAAISVLLVLALAGAGTMADVGAGQAQQDGDDAVFRANAGGDTVSVANGSDWSGDAGQHVTGAETYDGYDGTVALDASVPSGTPAELFETEFYGDQQWTISEGVQSNSSYEVRLYFAEIFHGVSNDGGAGARVFDVDVENETVLDDYDIVADVGSEAGVAKSVVVRPSDGTIDVELTGDVDNAKISAVEVVPVAGAPGELEGASSVDLGNQSVGSTATETVSVTNLGDPGNASHPDVTLTDVSVSGIDGTQFSASVSGNETVAPGESTELSVSFSPQDAGAKTATLTVEHTGDGSPLTVDLDGTGTERTSASEPTVVAVNAGGGEYTASDGTRFQPDESVEGGSMNTVAESVDGTDDDPLYWSQREGAFAYDLPVPNGTYDVTLHFAEPSYGVDDSDEDPVGERQFGVSVEGARRLSGYDVAAAAGGPLNATQETVAAGVSDGTLDVAFDPDTDDATLAAIEVSNRSSMPNVLDGPANVDYGAVPFGDEPTRPVTLTNLGSPTDPSHSEVTVTNVSIGGVDADDFSTDFVGNQTVAPGESAVLNATFAATDVDASQAVLTVAHTASNSPLTVDLSAEGVVAENGTAFAVNAGGDTYTTADGTVFAADAFYDGGSTYDVPESVGGTEDDPLYQTERFGDFGYDVPVPDGSYEVRLHFAEIHHGTASGDGDVGEDQRGERQFDVAVEGDTVLSSYDVYAESGGSLEAADESIRTTVNDGELNVDLATVEDSAKLSAVEIVHADPAPNELAGPDGVDFGSVGAENATARTVSLLNLGDALNESHPDVAITDLAVDGSDSDAFSAALSGNATVAPGAATDVELTFDPAEAGSKSATLVVGHSGTDAPLTVDLAGVALAADDTVFAVNAGGDSYTTTDGTEFAADTAFDGGSTYDVSGSIAGTQDDPLYQSERFGDFGYDVPVENGSYEVTVHFAEIYHGTGSGDGEETTDQTGARQFDVALEGETALDAYDVFAEADGSLTATEETLAVSVSDGVLDVDLSTVKDSAKISAIEVTQLEPEANALHGPVAVDFGGVSTDSEATETVTLLNLGEPGNGSHPDVTVTNATVGGTTPDAFSTSFAGNETVAPGETVDVPVTFDPTTPDAFAGTLTLNHTGTDSPLTVSLTGQGTTDVSVGFGKSTLANFSTVNPTAMDFGPDGRAYVSNQDGIVYSLDIERSGEDEYAVVDQTAIDAINDVPNHDDLGNHDPSVENRQITGLTVEGTAEQPIVYVSSSDSRTHVGDEEGDADSKDTNSGAVSRLVLDYDQGQLVGVDHELAVIGLPRSEENHGPNGLEVGPDHETLYLAVGGNTNKGAPSDSFGQTSEYALSAAILEIDLGQIYGNNTATSLTTHDSDYPDLDYRYALPTVQGGTLPYGGENGHDQAKLVEGGPVQIYSPGYRNAYDVVRTEDDQLYAADHGPNGGWGGTPVGEGAAGTCTNEPNEDDAGTLTDHLHHVTEGSYGGHPVPIRANPDGAGLYDAARNQTYDFTAADTPVPFSMADPEECEYLGPTEDGSIGPTFGPTGAIDEYTASNFDGAMQGDLLLVELGGTVNRIELNAAGDGVLSTQPIFNTDGPLGLSAQGDDESFPGTVWTANHGGGELTVFEPNDYGDSGSGVVCSGEDDATLDEDGDGYDNADEIDADSNPCSAASTPGDFDDDGTSNVNDPDDDNDGTPDTEDRFALDSNDGLATSLPVEFDHEPNEHPGTLVDLGYTGLMTNEADDYRDLYDPDQMTSGGAASVMTVEQMPAGTARGDANSQQFAFQVGIDACAEPFTVESTVAGYPDSPAGNQSMGLFVGTGDQDDFAELVLSPDDGAGGVRLATEVEGNYTVDAVVGDENVTDAKTDLRLTVFPSNATVRAHYATAGGNDTFVGEASVPSSWLHSDGGSGTATGVLATSAGANDTFDATWEHLYVTPLESAGANASPCASFTTDPSSPTAGQEVTFDASSSFDPNGSVASYQWDFGDGTTAAGDDATQTHTYDEPGTYDVSLQITDEDGMSATQVQTIDVGEQLGAASVTVTPESDADATTHTSGSFVVENTGEEDIETVTVDLASSAMPDVVFDPQGTAGDPSSKGFTPDSGADAVGLGSHSFGSPHDGGSGSDGYEELTIAFDDFEPGESLAFSADVDPTSIKGTEQDVQPAGPVSGLELARSTVAVEFADGTVQTADLFGDGSAGGAGATVDANASSAPSLAVVNRTLDDGALRAHHSATSVFQANHTMAIDGEPGQVVTVLHTEAALDLENVPDSDDPGSPGYDVEEYEANAVEQVDYETVTLDSNGTATVPVTLANSTSNGGYNYVTTAAGDPGTGTGAVSDVVVLQYRSSPTSNGTVEAT